MLAPFLGTQSTLLSTKSLESIEQGKTAKPLPGDDQEKPHYTGRFFVILNDGRNTISEAVRTFENTLNAKVASSSDFVQESISEEKIQDADVFVYEDLNIALIGADRNQVADLQASFTNETTIIPELVVYTIPQFIVEEEMNIVAAAETWGIRATNVNNSRYTGRDVPVAILDTGLDLTHPDFAGRQIVSHSFVPGIKTVQDVGGHGTHCTGTACGYIDSNGLRYGVAHESIIYSGKVLDNTGRGAQAWIVNGIDWAANNGCKVISMSLGSTTYPGTTYNEVYERSARDAVSKGAVIVAAAGNDSRRTAHPPSYFPVSSPASCPSILAVGALRSDLGVASFSNRAINPNQVVDIAAPGVNIHSSWLLPKRYNSISGTSMATPHVAGVLALLWEKNPTFSPQQIIQELLTTAQPLQHPGIDVGAGMVMAP